MFRIDLHTNPTPTNVHKTQDPVICMLTKYYMDHHQCGVMHLGLAAKTLG